MTYSTSILFFFDLSADVLIRVVDSDEVFPNLLTSKHGKALPPKSDKTVRLTMLSNNLGRKSRIDLWLDTDLTALQRTQLDTNRRYRRKIFRFLENGVYTLENKPKKKETRLPVDSWSKKSEGYHEADPNFTGHPLTDDTALFYAISASTKLNNPGDSITLFTFDKQANFEVTVAAIEEQQLKVNYHEVNNGNARVVKGKVSTLKLLLTAHPYNQIDDVETKFLNLNEGIDIYLDLKTRVILQISANLKYLGRVNITLDRLVLN